jgi:hypothetical protein
MFSQQHVWDTISNFIDMSTVRTNHLTLLNMSLILNNRVSFIRLNLKRKVSCLPLIKHYVQALKTPHFLLHLQAFEQGGY